MGILSFERSRMHMKRSSELVKGMEIPWKQKTDFLSPDPAKSHERGLREVKHFLQLAEKDHYALPRSQVCESWEHYAKVCVREVIPAALAIDTGEVKSYADTLRDVKERLQRALYFHYTLTISEVVTNWEATYKVCLKKIDKALDCATEGVTV